MKCSVTFAEVGYKLGKRPPPSGGFFLANMFWVVFGIKKLFCGRLVL